MDSLKLERLAKRLAGKGVLAWAWKKDGTLTVINAQGKKLFFDADSCQKAIDAGEKIQSKKGGKGGKPC